MKKAIKKETMITKREFSYMLGNVRLNFTLRTDIKGELKDFLEILKDAVQDVVLEIESHESKTS